MIIDCSISLLNNVKLLTNNNVDTVGRYYCSSDDPLVSKLITPAEAGQIAKAGVKLFIVYEGPLDLTTGASQATTAMNCANGIGQPAGSAIYFGIEKDGGFTAADLPQITTYFKDIGKTIAGKFDIGIYSN